MKWTGIKKAISTINKCHIAKRNVWANVHTGEVVVSSPDQPMDEAWSAWKCIYSYSGLGCEVPSMAYLRAVADKALAE